MRVLVCGDRKWDDEVAIKKELEALPPDSVIIQGFALGADRIAYLVASQLHLECISYPAQWKKYGRAAGQIRNMQMLLEGKPDVIFAFHHNILASKGTRNMVEQGLRTGVPVFLFSLDGKGELKGSHGHFSFYPCS